MNIDGMYLLDVEPIERSCEIAVDREDKGVNLIWIPYASKIERQAKQKAYIARMRGKFDIIY